MTETQLYQIIKIKLSQFEPKISQLKIPEFISYINTQKSNCVTAPVSL